MDALAAVATRCRRRECCCELELELIQPHVLLLIIIIIMFFWDLWNTAWADDSHAIIATNPAVTASPPSVNFSFGPKIAPIQIGPQGGGQNLTDDCSALSWTQELGLTCLESGRRAASNEISCFSRRLKLVPNGRRTGLWIKQGTAPSFRPQQSSWW